MASAGEDGFIRVWDFRKRTLQAEIKVRACCQAARSSQLKRLMRAARLHDAMPCLCLPLLPHGPHRTPLSNALPPRQVGAPVKRVCNHPGTGLMAAACGDHVVRMYDVEVRLMTVFFMWLLIHPAC